MAEIFEMVEQMNETEFEQFANLDAEWRCGVITEDEMATILEERFGITMADYYEYFED